MVNFNLKKYLANNPLLNEIKINQPVGARIIKDPKIVDWLRLSALFEFNASGFRLNSPLGNEFNYGDTCEIYPDKGENEWDTWDDFNKNDICKIFKYFSEKPKGIYLLSNKNLAPALGAPNNSFYEKITVEDDFGDANYDKDSMENLWIYIETPWISEGPNGNYHHAGWFDARGKYHADDKNFDEDGNYIGNP